jgi:hypothetical protein
LGFWERATEKEVSDHRFAKEYSGAKDSLEAVHKTAISLPAFERAEEIAEFGRGPQAHDTAAPTNPVLTAWQPQLRMPEQLKEKLSVSSRKE